MKSKTNTGATSIDYDAFVMTCKASADLLYGDVVVMGTQDGGPYTVVNKSAADDTTVLGVVSQHGGIASGEVGEVTVLGWAECNVASATYSTPGAKLNTNGGGAGTAAAGTWAAGKGVGLALGDETGAVTQTTVFVRPT